MSVADHVKTLDNLRKYSTDKQSRSSLELYLFDILTTISFCESPDTYSRCKVPVLALTNNTVPGSSSLEAAKEI